MAEKSKTQSLLKPTMVVTGPKDTVVVKDVYEQSGEIKPVNSYVKKDASIASASSYIATNKPKVDFKPADLTGGGNANKGAVSQLMTASKPIQSRVKHIVSDGNYGTLEGLTDKLKTSLVGDVIDASTAEHKPINSIAKSLSGGDKLSVDDYAKTITKDANKVSNTNDAGTIVHINNITKIVKSDPFDVKGIQTILQGMAKEDTSMDIVDIAAVAGTVATVLKFANEWGIPSLVKAAMGSIKDKNLKLRMLKNAALTASLSGDINLTKFYTKELEDESKDITSFLPTVSNHTLATIAHTLCSNLIRHYRITKDDANKEYPVLATELIAYLDELNPNWTGPLINDTFYFKELTYASKDAITILLRSKYAAQTSVLHLLGTSTVSAIINRTFPKLLSW